MWPEKVIPGVNGVHGRGNPVPLASHEDVVKDRTLFMNTLRSFHFSLGSKFLVPVIGGKELNLHVLYVEVTRRGGYDKVVNEKKWREISSVFDFSPTTTSASYALRKHYFTLLHRYELVYFFRLQPSFLNQSGHSFQAIGTIDAKFDCGYLVSVRLGNETLNGVLYHPAGYPPASASTHQPCNVIVPYTHSFISRDVGLGEEGRVIQAAPSPTGVGESWNNLPPEEREVYQSYGLKDKERYQKELKEYKERLKVLSSSMIMRKEY
ncbi:UNVERIFIED_CONTAM: High mobility group B protein 9 [Sesamum latifolium]|uniref:High mobility group B protein 9 n=1 Tax=Sesamum latifolium TaxID=2727402 RepID=A0AAW2WCC7_9LAMI